ncbi:MAG: hypothetical protein RIQ72_21 [Candidatus Parcubacteria bacterium]|jgi:uncharacterized protein
MKTHMMSRIVHSVCVFVYSSLLVIGLAVFSAGVIGVHTDAYAYTNPGTPTGFVNDFAQILTAEQKQMLEQSLKDFEVQTTHEISVVTIPTLSGDTIENYANELFADWKIGKEGVDNGVLLLIALEDKKVRIEVGYGLEGALTDAESKYIIDKVIIPAFKNGQFAEGVQAGAETIKQAVVDEVVVVSSASAKSRTGFAGFIEKALNIIFSAFEFFLVIGIVLFQLITSILAKSKAWWHGGVLGGLVGIAILFFAGLSIGIISTIVLVVFGLLIDYHVSKSYKAFKAGGTRPWFMSSGGHGGGWSSGGGGFGGFGGGSSGGGGASGGW